MMHGSWDIECDRQIFFVILEHFLAFYPPSNPKNQNFEKNEKNAWRYYHFTQVYHKWQSYGVWQVYHKWQSYYDPWQVSYKWQSYDEWFLRYEVWQTEFFVILDCFLPFYPSPPLKTRKIKIWKNEKKYLEKLSFYTCVP